MPPPARRTTVNPEVCAALLKRNSRHTHGLGARYVLHEKHGMAKARQALENLNYTAEKVSLLKKEISFRRKPKAEKPRQTRSARKNEKEPRKQRRRREPGAKRRRGKRATWSWPFLCPSRRTDQTSKSPRSFGPPEFAAAIEEQAAALARHAKVLGALDLLVPVRRVLRIGRVGCDLGPRAGDHGLGGHVHGQRITTSRSCSRGSSA